MLLIEDDPIDTRLIAALLAHTSRGVPQAPAFELIEVDSVPRALTRLVAEHVDVVLLDLTLASGQGLDLLAQLRADAPDVPIVVQTVNDDEALGIAAVKAGAQDYLVQGHVDSHLLTRTLRYAIERHRMQATLRALSLTDELTGLYNRRGFRTLADQHLKLARRTGRELLLLYADLDDFKQINDKFGHAEGDAALVRTAELLRAAFRETDILARVGGDEFTVLAIDGAGPTAGLIVDRLRRRLVEHNAANPRGYELSLSIGVAHFGRDEIATLDEFLDRADRALYDDKRHLHRRRARAAAH